MTKTPWSKLNEFFEFEARISDMIVGAGNSEGVIIPKQLIFLVFFGIILEVVHINGIIQNLSHPTKICSLILIYSLAIQIVVGLFNRIAGNDLEPIIHIREQLKILFEKEQKDPSRWPMLDSSLNKGINAVKGYILISFIFYHTPIVTSIIVSFWKQEFIMAFDVYMPFTGPNTLIGYLFNMTIQTLASTFIYAILIMKYHNLIFHSSQTVLFIDLFKYKMENFAKLLEDFHDGKVPKEDLPEESSSSKKTEIMKEKHRQKKLEVIEIELIALIKSFEFYNEFIKNYMLFAKPSEFIVLSLNSFGMGLAIIHLRMESFPIGLAFLAVMIFPIFVDCFIGSLIISQNEKLLDSVCNFPWYQLTPKMKKVYLQFVHQCQHAEEFELPIIGTVDMELFSDIMNASYSYLQYLMNFM